VKIVSSLFSDSAWTLPESDVSRLRAAIPHHEVVNAPSRESRLRELPDADIAFLTQLRPEEFATATRLRWIQSAAAGVAGLLFPALQQSPVVLTNARGIHGDAMAEHVIGVTIALFRQLHRAIRHQVTHQWLKDPLEGFRTLRGSRLAVIGLGAIGTAVAERAVAFGMDVVAVRRRAGAPRPAVVSAVYAPSELPAVLGMSDVVVLTAPLTPETRGFFGAEQFRQMKRDGVLVNVARGKLVCESELAEALASGIIGGAALDVVEHEPLDAASPLWDLPNVIITPHTSAFRADYWALAVDLFVENLRRFDRGEPLVNVVDKVLGYPF
jgi:phosphoglycerate dehydrogenase-like enzyme